MKSILLIISLMMLNCSDVISLKSNDEGMINETLPSSRLLDFELDLMQNGIQDQSLQNQCVDRAVHQLEALGIQSDSLPLVAKDPNACDKLRYGYYRNEGDNQKLHHLPDFSYAGYLKGGVALPSDIPTVLTLSPTDGNQRAQIQAAIDQESYQAVESC